MAKQSLKMQSWQVFHFARKHLGSSVLCVLFGKKNARAVDYWCQDPACTQKCASAYDPLFGVQQLINKLDDHGHIDVVRAIRAFLFADTSVDDCIEPSITELRANMDAEKLFDFSAVAEFHKAIDDGSSEQEIEQLKLEAIGDIERTMALYKKERGHGA